MNKFKKGFTLIELLVVIAIIGILAAVVLTSLSGARDKANKAAFKAELSGIHPAAISHCDGVTDNATYFGFNGLSKISNGNIHCTNTGGIDNTTISANGISSCNGIVSNSGVTFNCN